MGTTDLTPGRALQGFVWIFETKQRDEYAVQSTGCRIPSLLHAERVHRK
jgi:hypothetical protein